MASTTNSPRPPQASGGQEERLAIVIVNYQTWDHLAALLNGINSDRWEIVVIDNASPDDRFAEFVQRFPAVQFRRAGANVGFGAGCNLGASLTTSVRLLFVNPDCVLTDTQLERLLATTADLPTGISGPAQVGSDGQSQRVWDRFPSASRLLGVAGRSPRRKRADWWDVDWVTGACLLIDRPLFEKLGGWDEKFFMYSEDVDLCHRCWQMGHPVRFLPTVRVTHHHGGASRSSAQVTAFTKAHAIHSRVLFADKHYHGGQYWRYRVALWLTRELRLTVMSLIPGSRASAVARQLRELRE